MPNYYKDIRDFHEKFGLAYDGKPKPVGKEIAMFRVKFLFEELVEYVNASSKVPFTRTEIEEMEKLLLDPIEHYYEDDPSPKQLEHQFDALLDLLYVAFGTGHLHGFQIDEGWDRVHYANMQKERAIRADQSARRSTLDVIKPAGWLPPKLDDLL